MAKIAPKGKKVVGTKKKDKITWAATSPWKKNLTVKAGAGNDVINFKKSKFKNKLYGEAGNDKIYGGKGADKIWGGKGNDTIQAGKGNNTLYFSKGDGKDTVLKGGGTDTLVFKTEKNINNIKISYSGNDAVIAYDGGSVILKDYKKGGHSAKFVQVGSSKKAIADLLKPSSGVVGGYYVINGTAGNDNLVAKDEYNCKINAGAGNDTITGGTGNDIIYAGAGNDSINPGLGNNYIYLGEGANTIVYDELKTERRDTIVNFGPNDTLYFPTLTRPNDLFFDEYNEELDCLTIGWNSKNLRINILDYSNTNRNGYVKFGDNDPMRMEDFLATHYMAPMRIYSNGADVIENFYYGGKIYTRGGNDTITNVHYDNGRYLQLYSGTGDDSITGLGNYSSVWGGEGNDTIEADSFVHHVDFNGEDGDDVIRILGGSNQTYTYLRGGAGNDTIVGCQHMYGGDGDDDITAVSAKCSDNYSYISGGTGDDKLRRDSENGGDVNYGYSMNDPNGNDTIYDSFAGESNINFSGRDKDGAKFIDSLRYYVDGNDLILRYKNMTTGSYENNSIRIKDYMTSENKNNLRMYITGSELSYEPLEDWIAQKGYTGDVMNGTDAGESIEGTLYNDTIYGLGGNDTISGGNGRDYIDGGDGDDELDGGSDTNTICGGAGADVIYSFGTDSIYGGAGNDIIHLNGNSNVEIFIAPDDGNDRIAGGINNTTQTNINTDQSASFWAQKDENSLIINSLAYKNGEYYEQQITINDYYNGDDINTDVADKLKINGSTVDFSALPDPYQMTDADNHAYTMTTPGFLYATEGDDTITGSDGADVIYAGGGNDVINAGGGDDMIYLGSGTTTLKIDLSVLNATVHNPGESSEWTEYTENGAKTICMKDDTYLILDFDDDLLSAGGTGVFCRGSGTDNDLYISVDGGMGYCLRIKDYFDENGNPKTEHVVMNIQGATYTVPGWADGSYWGRTFDIQPFGDYDGVIHGTNMPYEWLMYTGGFGKDDTIYGGNGNTENIYVRNGNDVIYANEGTKNIFISGNRSSSDLYLGTDSNTKTTLYLGGVDYNSNYLANPTASGDLYLSWSCYENDYSSDKYGCDTLIHNWTTRTSQFDIKITGDNRGNTLRGYNGIATTIDGGLGNDLLYGGTGVDTFSFNLNLKGGYGTDTIESGANSADILQFEWTSTGGVSFDDFKFYKYGDNNLVIGTKNPDNDDSYVVINNYYTTEDKVDRMVINRSAGENEEASLSEMLGEIGDAMGIYARAAGNTTITGTEYSDILMAEYGKNTIEGGAGDDTIRAVDGSNNISGDAGADIIYVSSGSNTISGGIGNDIINVTGGNSTFVYNTGDGSDIMYQGGSYANNVLEFKNATLDQLTAVTGYDRQGYDLLVHYDGTNTLTVKDFYDSSKNKINYIKDSTGTTYYKATDYFKRVEYITSLTKYMQRSYTNASEDLRITADLSAFDIEGYGGSDRIWGTDNNEWIYTGTEAGAYTYDSTTGVVDEIHAGGGDDYIFATSETNILYGDAGDDKVYILAGTNNRVSDSSGEHDMLAINSADGSDNALYNNLHFVFNVDSSGNVDDAGLRILTNAEFDLWKTDTNYAGLKGIQVVKDADGNGAWNSFETYEDAGDENGCSHLSVSALNDVKADIAGWLLDNGYIDVNDVFTNEKTEGDIGTLVAKFDVTDKWVYDLY